MPDLANVAASLADLQATINLVAGDVGNEVTRENQAKTDFLAAQVLSVSSGDGTAPLDLPELPPPPDSLLDRDGIYDADFEEFKAAMNAMRNMWRDAWYAAQMDMWQGKTVDLIVGSVGHFLAEGRKQRNPILGEVIELKAKIGVACG